ncbi:MAG: aerotaxis receptor Aer [Alphaproteobacteria bacterium]|nr:MAG: aerotaxis receptor Aer [Alphaproteobacteria bacterium]
MVSHSVVPVDEEIAFGEDEIIVSKTDMKGRLTYANDVFCRVAEMTTRDVIGQPHSIIRHPDMPRAVFKLLWDTIQAGKEIFAYVKNMSKTGKYYWVIAHVTPSIDENEQITGYHSNRRKPGRSEIEVISAIYQTLITEEKKHANSKTGMEASYALLQNILDEQGKTYSEFVWAVRG